MEDAKLIALHDALANTNRSARVGARGVCDGRECCRVRLTLPLQQRVSSLANVLRCLFVAARWRGVCFCHIFADVSA
jgi:hypothetical protein